MDHGRKAATRFACTHGKALALLEVANISLHPMPPFVHLAMKLPLRRAMGRRRHHDFSVALVPCFDDPVGLVCPFRHQPPDVEAVNPRGDAHVEDGVLGANGLRQVAPGSTCPGKPSHCLHEPSWVPCGSLGIIRVMREPCGCWRGEPDHTIMEILNLNKPWGYGFGS